jgi:hypothetical protein
MKRSHQESAKFWQQHIEAARSFPGSVQKYCDVHKIESSSFYQWRKRISEMPNPGVTDFLPVVISKPERLNQNLESRMPNAQWVAEVMLHLLRGFS